MLTLFTLLVIFSMNCMIAHDLIKFAITLEVVLKDILHMLKPDFTLVGSMAEGTRIGLASELDLSLSFKTWEESIPLKVGDNPFSLKMAETAPTLMSEFFDTNGDFQFHKFKQFLLQNVESAIGYILANLLNPKNLKCVTTNETWRNGTCKSHGNCSELMKKGYMQCDKCAVTVSQTKIGIALQFEWEWNDEKIYCSIDLIPLFPIIGIDALELARLVNTAMLGPEKPHKWLKYIYNYFKHYKIIIMESHQQNDHQAGKIDSVVLKTFNFQQGKNHHIRPAQPSSESGTFLSPRMKDIYCYIKFLKKAAGLDISSYWVKRELQNEQYQLIVDPINRALHGYGGHADDLALVQVLSQPEFRSKVDGKIDFTESNKKGHICLRK